MPRDITSLHGDTPPTRKGAVKQAIIMEYFHWRRREKTERIYKEQMSTMATPKHKGSDERSVKLTKREIEVLSLIIEGRSSKEVADLLFVSKRTVDFHLANIYDKLQVSNRVQAFRRAASLGLIPFDTQKPPYAES